MPQLTELLLILLIIETALRSLFLKPVCLYRAVIILYLLLFTSYVIFTRVPDYFDGELIHGVVSKATFSEKENSPQLVVDYNVGSEKLQYKTDNWFLTSYKPGQIVTIIYNPAHPRVSSIYAIIGYWIKWNELAFSIIVFVVLFLIARYITGTTREETVNKDEPRKKRKYDD